jgi:hypothetical protein
MIPFNVSSYIHQTNYDTAVPSEIISNIDLYQPHISLKDQEQYVRQLAPEVKESMEMTSCIIQTEGGKHNVMGNSRSIWFRSFPKDTREYFFRDDSPECTFALIMNVLRLTKRTLMGIQEIKQELWRGYQSVIGDDQRNIQKIMNILYDQNKRPLLERTQNNLETAIMLDDYFISDLDLWVLMSHLNIPCVLFSTGKIKMADVDNWLYLTRSNETDDLEFLYESMVYIRSPRMVDVTKYPQYSLIMPTYKPSEMGEVGQNIQNSSPETANIQSITTLFDNMRIIIKKRGRPKKMVA